MVCVVCGLEKVGVVRRCYRSDTVYLNTVNSNFALNFKFSYKYD